MAQIKAGIEYDRTLMFNDRAGFRNSSALTYRPWNLRKQKPHKIKVQPTILMDSHLYDYKDLNPTSRKQEIRYWISETKQVNGSASILWHHIHYRMIIVGWMALRIQLKELFLMHNNIYKRF